MKKKTKKEPVNLRNVPIKLYDYSLRLLGWKLIVSHVIKFMHLAANKARGMGRVKCKIL